MKSRKHVVLVIHGARAELPELRHLVDWVRAKGHRVTTRVTWECGDATTFAREAAALAPDAVVAVGGDGTVNEVVNGLADGGADIPLGIIPLGTANDFARQIGLPADVDHAMDVILRRKPVRIDTATLNGRRFVNVSTAGVGAEATAATAPETKEALGALAYAITGMRRIRTLEPRRARFTGPGFAFDGEFLAFAVGNARATGGGTVITPRASVTDGLLDLCIVEAAPLAEFARLVLRIKRGEHVGAERVRYAQLPFLRVRAESEIIVNVDGESSPAQELDYQVRPRDLLMHLVHLPGESG